MIEQKCFSTSTEREKWILFLYHAHEHPVACSFFIFLSYLRQSLPLCEGELNQERRSELAAWHRAEEGRAAGCRGSLCLDLLRLLGPQPAFLRFFFTLWMSWCLKTENITSGTCDFSHKAGAGVGTGQCVQLGAALDLLGNKWIKVDCHWKSGRCLSQTGLGCFLYLCQYFLKLGQYFSVCSFILALSRSFKRGLNMVPDDSF